MGLAAAVTAAVGTWVSAGAASAVGVAAGPVGAWAGAESSAGSQPSNASTATTSTAARRRAVAGMVRICGAFNSGYPTRRGWGVAGCLARNKSFFQKTLEARRGAFWRGVERV